MAVLYRKQKELPPNTRTHGNTYNNSTFQDGANTQLHKSKEKPPSKARVADRSVDQMCAGPGGTARSARPRRSYPRPRGATVGRSRRRRSCAPTPCPGVVGESSPACSTRMRRLAPHSRHHGWGGERTGSPIQRPTTTNSCDQASTTIQRPTTTNSCDHLLSSFFRRSSCLFIPPAPRPALHGARVGGEHSNGDRWN